MCKSFLDIEDGDLCIPVSDDFFMDTEGHMMMLMGNDMAMDMDTGELHMIDQLEDDKQLF